MEVFPLLLSDSIEAKYGFRGDFNQASFSREPDDKKKSVLQNLFRTGLTIAKSSYGGLNYQLNNLGECFIKCLQQNRIEMSMQPRDRNKNGSWLKKRSDAGKPRKRK